MIASDICLLVAPARERRNAVHRLIELLGQDDWMLRDQIEQCLVVHFGSARDLVAEYLQGNALQEGEGGAPARQIKRSLRRVQDSAKAGGITA